MANFLKTLNGGQLLALIGKLAAAGMSSEAASAVLRANEAEIPRVEAAVRAFNELMLATTVVESPKNLAQMLAAAGIKPGNVNSDINESNFPIVEARFSAAGAVLKGFGKTVSTAYAEEWMRSEGKVRGTIEQGLAYLKANPDCLKDGPIVLLGSSWVDGFGSRLVAVLFLDGGVPFLYPSWVNPENEWNSGCRFLFVSGSSAGK